MPLKRRSDDGRRGSKSRFERSAFLVCFLSVYLLGPWRTELDTTKSREDVVFAYYYPTYNADSWTIHPLNDRPTLGSYESDNPLIAARHISWATQNDLNGFAVPWTGPGSPGDSSLRKGLLRAENAGDIKFFFIYSVPDRFQTGLSRDAVVDFKNQTARSVLVSDLIYLRDSLFKSPSYYTIDGIPVLAIRSSRTFRNFDKSVWTSIQREASVSVFSIGDECAIDEPNDGPDASMHVFETGRSGERLESTVFDAYFSFSFYSKPLVLTGDTSLAYYQRVVEPQYRKWAPAVPFFPTLVPEYIGWGHKPLFGTPSDFAAQIALSRSLPVKRVSDSIRSIFFVSSFNEWFEGSCLEPSKRTGYDYLNVLKISFSM